MVSLRSLGGEFVNKEAWGGRAFGALGSEYLQVSPFSAAVVRDPGSGVLRFSINPLFSLPLLATVAAEWDVSIWAVLPLVPQALTNLSVQVPVLGKSLYVTAGQRTDYYLLNDVSRIYTEGYIGARVLGGSALPLSAEVRYVWPVSQGFLENKGPYLGFGLSLAFLEITEDSRPLSGDGE